MYWIRIGICMNVLFFWFIGTFILLYILIVFSFLNYSNSLILLQISLEIARDRDIGKLIIKYLKLYYFEEKRRLIFDLIIIITSVIIPYKIGIKK